jgi:hypothetical protein
MKRAEALRDESVRSGTILRLQERAGIKTHASLRSAVLGLDHTVALQPWELKTLLVKSSPGGHAELKEVSLLEV